MMVLYCRRFIVKDRGFARQISALRGEMTIAREEGVDFVQELEIMSGVIATVKTYEFLNEMLRKDVGRLVLFQNLEREAKQRALEKELLFISSCGMSLFKSDDGLRCVLLECVKVVVTCLVKGVTPRPETGPNVTFTEPKLMQAEDFTKNRSGMLILKVIRCELLCTLHSKPSLP
ncbi:hypothetical protein Tco_1365952 [Tanacetum coccineum]